MQIRSEITKQLLADSLISLLREKTLSKISIQEIVDRCQLNRQTFYYHFEDIYKLIDWTFKRGITKPLSEYKGEALWREGLRETLIEFETNRTLYKNVLCDMTQDQLFNLFYENIATLVTQAIDEIVKDMQVDPNYIKNITQYFSISFGTIVEQWIFDRIHQSADELVEFLDTLIKDQIHGAMNRT